MSSFHVPFDKMLTKQGDVTAALTRLSEYPSRTSEFVGQNAQVLNEAFASFQSNSEVLQPRKIVQSLVAAQSFNSVEVSFDEQSRAYWCFMKPKQQLCFSKDLLNDLLRAQSEFQQIYSQVSSFGVAEPMRFCVLASKLPGVFNLGGDLELFSSLIRNQDRAGLQKYAYSCIEVMYNTTINFGVPVVTIALVQGDALGGGFEAALSCNVIVAEKSAKFGLPEILFNLFPGMGAYSLLQRRLDATRAEKLILSGRIYSAEDLHELGLVDVVCEDGDGVAAVERFTKQWERRHSALASIYNVRRIVKPVDYAELAAVTDVWVDTALRVSEQDLRTMSRLQIAQARRRAAAQQSASDSFAR